jgi:hypothetical protein
MCISKSGVMTAKTLPSGEITGLWRAVKTVLGGVPLTSENASYLDQFEVLGLSAFLVQAQTWSATRGKPLAATLKMVCR